MGYESFGVLCCEFIKSQSLKPALYYKGRDFLRETGQPQTVEIPKSM